MTKLNGPFFSFSAAGAIGKAVITQNRKGTTIAKSYEKPSNPQSPGQTLTRDAYALAVDAWHNLFNTATTRDAWRRQAAALTKPLSAYHAAISAVTLATRLTPHVVFTWAVTSNPANQVTHTIYYVDTHIVGQETGTFQIWGGLSPKSLQLIGSETDPNMFITKDTGQPAGTVYYTQLTKGGEIRSGIYAVTLG